MCIFCSKSGMQLQQKCRKRQGSGQTKPNKSDVFFFFAFHSNGYSTHLESDVAWHRFRLVWLVPFSVDFAGYVPLFLQNTYSVTLPVTDLNIFSQRLFANKSYVEYVTNLFLVFYHWLFFRRRIPS